MKVISRISKLIMVLPFLFFTFCDNIDNDIVNMDEPRLTVNDELIDLMKTVAIKNGGKVSKNKSIKKSSINTVESCTGFQYPLNFYTFRSDEEGVHQIVINNDDDLLEFFVTLTTTDIFYMQFPVTLLDIDGVETTIYNKEDLVGTLQYAIEACNDDTDSSTGDSGAANDGVDSSTDTTDDSTSTNNDGDSSGSTTGSTDDNSGSTSNDSTNTTNNDNGYEYCHSNGKKVYICHKGKTICVSVNAIWGHMTHHSEDKLGRCD